MTKAIILNGAVIDTIVVSVIVNLPFKASTPYRGTCNLGIGGRVEDPRSHVTIRA